VGDQVSCPQCLAKRYRRALVVGGLLFLISIATAALSDCSPDSVALDPAIWNTAHWGSLGMAVGQTFYAPETVVTKLTVWRPPNNRSVIGQHLYIVAVDTSQVPPRPDVHSILLDGPTVQVFDSDPPGQLIPMSFVLDPPLSLPARGIYAYFLQGQGCTGNNTQFIGNYDNPYPDGCFWGTSRSTPGCILPGGAVPELNFDFLFKIEFCRDATTPVLKKTWGKLKMIYR
jgi:hypothetical protein